MATTMGGGLLTTGFYDEIASLTGSERRTWPTSGGPILQILQTKPISCGDEIRWQMVVSDGVHAMQAMVVIQLNPLLENGEVGKGCIIRVQHLAVNTIQKRR